MVEAHEDPALLSRDFAQMTIEALAEMRRNPDEAERRRERQIAYVRENYSWSERALEWQSLPDRRRRGQACEHQVSKMTALRRFRIGLVSAFHLARMARRHHFAASDAVACELRVLGRQTRMLLALLTTFAASRRAGGRGARTGPRGDPGFQDRAASP